MKNILLILFFCFTLCGLTFGQTTQQEDKEKAAEQQRQRDFNSRIDNLRNVGKTQVIRDRYKDTEVYKEIISPLYREVNQRDLILLSPDEEFSTKYADFLKQKQTGLIKLIVDKGCDQAFEIINSDPHCLKYDMPGAGASYSFRVKNYRVKRLSDLTFTGNKLSSEGILTNSIFVNLGRVELDNLTLKSAGINILKGFEPPTNIEQANKLTYLLEKGIQGENYLFTNKIDISKGDTCALRSIAYKGNSYQTVKDITYDEFEFDQRKDVIIIFKIVNFDKETLTLLWKELDSRKSSKIK